MTPERTVAVRMDMGAQESAAMSVALVRTTGEARHRLKDQVWLMAVLCEQRQRTHVAERPAFTERANRILAALDQSEGVA